MYRIDRENWGITITFSENLTLEEAQRYNEEVGAIRVQLAGKSWGVLCDCRNLGVMMPGAQELLTKSQEDGKKAGMGRTCVILAAPIPIMYAKRFAKSSGIYAWERYLNGRSNPDWKLQAVDWITKGIDPDTR
jgi:hypothetical protein